MAARAEVATMTSPVTRIAALSLALALAAVTVPGDLADNGGDASLAPTASAHVCVEPAKVEVPTCTEDDCSRPLVQHSHVQIQADGDIDQCHAR